MAKFKKIVKWLICLSSFVLFGFLTYWVVNGKFYQVDNLVYKKIFELISPLNINFFVKLLTNFAGPELLIFLCVVLLVLITDKKVSIGICSNLVLSTLLNIIIKNIVARPRPSVESLIIENGYSFPSGHSMACVAFYGFLIYLLWQTKYPKKAKITLTSILSLLILMVGISRIYLGVHYFSDVLAGFVLSLGYLIIFVTIYSKIKIPKRKKSKRKKRLLQ